MGDTRSWGFLLGVLGTVRISDGDGNDVVMRNGILMVRVPRSFVLDWRVNCYGLRLLNERNGLPHLNITSYWVILNPS